MAGASAMSMPSFSPPCGFSRAPACGPWIESFTPSPSTPRSRSKAEPDLSSHDRPGIAAALVADGAEFVAGVPVRPVGRIRKLAADLVEDLKLVERARPVP